MANGIPKINYDTGPTTFTFPFPADGDPDDQPTRKANVKVTTSTTGTEQVQFNYNEEKFTAKFTFLSDANIESLKLWHDFAITGQSFDYFPDSDEVAFVTYTLDRAGYTFDPKKLAVDLFELTLRFRRVL